MRKLKNQNGFTLIGVMVVLVILSVLGLSVVTLALGSVKVSSGERDEESAYYIAEAGLTYEMAEVEQKAVDIYENKNIETEAEFFTNLDEYFNSLPEKYEKCSELKGECPLVFKERFGDKPEIQIKVTKLTDENLRKYEMLSIGKIGTRTRTVSQEFIVNWSQKGNGGYVPEMALFVKEQITLENGTINGDIATLKEGPNSIIILENPTINGDMFVPKGSENYALSKPDWKEGSQPIGKNLGALPDFPDPPELPHGDTLPDQQVFKKNNKAYVIKDGKLLINHHLTNNFTLNLTKPSPIEFSEIILDSNYTLEVNVGDYDKKIVVDHLNMNNGHINLTGKGTLSVYIIDKFTIGSGSTINDNGDVKQLNMYFYKSNNQKTITIGGSQKIFGSLYAEDANLDLGAGGGVKGNIFTGGNSIKVSGGTWSHAPLIFAPNAAFEMSGGGEIKGAVIAKSFLMNGGAKLVYDEENPLDFTEGPISGEIIGGNPEDQGGISINKKPILEN